MRKRLKYKVGDILEWWQQDRINNKHLCNYYIIVDVKNEKTLHGNTIWYYYMKPVIEPGEIFELRSSGVDMTLKTRYVRICLEGWRKVA